MIRRLRLAWRQMLAGLAGRDLQEEFRRLQWDYVALRDSIHERNAAHHGAARSVVVYRLERISFGTVVVEDPAWMPRTVDRVEFRATPFRVPLMAATREGDSLRVVSDLDRDRWSAQARRTLDEMAVRNLASAIFFPAQAAGRVENPEHSENCNCPECR